MFRDNGPTRRPHLRNVAAGELNRGNRKIKGRERGRKREREKDSKSVSGRIKTIVKRSVGQLLFEPYRLAVAASLNISFYER